MIVLLLKTYQQLGLVKHQILISVFGVSSRCQHRPTCSRYLAKQIKERGTIVGLLRGFSRLVTCW